MSPAASAAELRALMEQAVFARDYRFSVSRIDAGLCTLLVPFQSALERPGGLIGGPVFMAAADVAMWLAILTRLGVADRSVTSAMTTSFLSAARREDFLCTARVMKLGRRLIHGTAECVSADGRLLTHHTITYARRDRSN
jgi:acyl-coenzyme A thioesterase PaaI-like protein